MVLRSCGKTRVRAAIVRLGSRLVGGVFALMVEWTWVFCWLLARRSVARKEVAVGGQVCAAKPFEDGCIAWQLVVADAV